MIFPTTPHPQRCASSHPTAHAPTPQAPVQMARGAQTHLPRRAQLPQELTWQYAFGQAHERYWAAD